MMEYEEEENRATGSIPEFGAIFMSNLITKRECYKRNVFALPASRAEFVRRVKDGMPLFLFEFEKRQLFGVFQASSDGAMDIVPDGFNYSGKRFPAQVSVIRIWTRHPLSEREFRDAIRENYYTTKKFKFGLSEDQVRRLLSLFNSRRVPSEFPPLPRVLTEATYGAESGKDSGLANDERFGLSERAYEEYDDYDYRWNSLKRTTEDELAVENVGKSQGSLTNYDYDVLSKRRRVGYDEAENEMYDRGSSRPQYVNHSVHDSDEQRRLVDGSRLSTFDRGLNENQVDRQLNPVHREYLVDPMEVRTDYARFTQRDRLSTEHNLYNARSEAYGEPLMKHRHAMDDGGFSIHDCLQRDCNACDGRFKSFLRARDAMEECHHLMKEKMENQYHVHTDDFPVGASEPFGTLLHNIRKTTASDPATDRIEMEHILGTSVVGFSSETFSRPLDLCRRAMHYGNFPNVEGGASENGMDNIPRSAALNKESGYKCLPETGPSRFSAAQNYEPSRSMFHDAISPRAVPYIPELPMVSCGFPSSAADWTSSQGQETYPHHSSSRIYSLSNNFVSRPLDAHEIGNGSSRTNSLSHPMLHKTTSSFLNSDVPMHTAPRTPALVSCRDLTFSKFSSPLPPSGHENIEDEKISFIYPSKTSKACLAPAGHLQKSSQQMSEHYVPRKLTDMLAGSDFICSEANNSTEGVYNPGGDLSSYHDRYIRSSSNMDLKENQEVSEAPQPDTNTGRTSVFKRLTSVQDIKVGEEKKDRSVNCYEAASADEVMEMLREGKNLTIRNSRKSKVVGGKHGKDALEKKQIQSCDDISRSIAVVNKMKDEYLAIAESTDEVRKETRVVDFKRRSETKKSLVGNVIDTVGDTDIVLNREVESPTKKNTKRKKLVRPVFGKIESSGEGLGSKPILQLSGQIRNNDGKNNCVKAIGICQDVMSNENASLSNILASHGQQSLCGDGHTNTNGQKDLAAAPMLSPTNYDLEKEHHQVSNLSIQTDELKIVTAQHKKNVIDTVADNDVIHNREVESPIRKILNRKRLLRPVFGKIDCAVEGLGSNQNLQLSGQIRNNDGNQNCEKAIRVCIDVSNEIGSLSNILASQGQQSLCGDGHSNTNKQKDLAAAHMLPPSNHDLEKEHHQVSNLSFQRNELRVVTAQHKKSARVLSKEVDSTVESLNLKESSLEGLKLDAISEDPREEEKSSMLKKTQSLGILSGGLHTPTPQHKNPSSDLFKEIDSTVKSSIPKENSSEVLKLDPVSVNPREGEKLMAVERIDYVGHQSGPLQLLATKH